MQGDTEHEGQVEASDLGGQLDSRRGCDQKFVFDDGDCNTAFSMILHLANGSSHRSL